MAVPREQSRGQNSAYRSGCYKTSRGSFGLLRFAQDLA